MSSSAFADVSTLFLGLGSNAPHAQDFLDKAVKGIEALPSLCLERVSSVYVTEPQDYTEQPWFYNQVVLARVLQRDLEPVILMQQLLALETRLGRVRSPDPALRFGPRVIDIDMLLFAGHVSTDPVCLLPHPRLKQRAFWLVPLKEIAPWLTIAEESLDTLLARLTWHQDGNKIYQS